MKHHASVNNSQTESISLAVNAIRCGGVVAIPTETYYGLAVDPENEEALQRLFTLKQRPANKPILILISKVEQLLLYAQEIPKVYESLINRYWPGPLTLIFEAKPHVSSLLTGGTGTIGIRLTPNEYARTLIDEFGKPITATSANISAYEPARNVRDVRNAFGSGIDGVVDGGPSTEGPGSTVISFSRGKLCVLRRGRIAIPGIPECTDF